MVWVKDANPHEENHVGILALTPGLAFALLRNGAIVGLIAGLVIGWWHRNQFDPYRQVRDGVAVAHEFGAKQAALEKKWGKDCAGRYEGNHLVCFDAKKQAAQDDPARQRAFRELTRDWQAANGQ